MTTTDHIASLHTIGDDNLTTTEPGADVRDRRVVDKVGEDIGHVDDLLVDDREHKVRFLSVAAGGFLGLGEAKFLIPVDAITSIDDKAVHVDQTRDHTARGPRYDPKLIDEVTLNDVYGHYGYGPWWSAVYTRPAEVVSKSKMMTHAPLEYAVIRVEADHFSKEIVPELVAIQRAGSVQVVDLLLVTKDAQGVVVSREVHELGDEDTQPYGDLADNLEGLLTPDDIAALAADLPASESAAIVLLEHCWTQGLGEAVGRAGGKLLTGGLVSTDALARVDQELSAVPTQ